MKDYYTTLEVSPLASDEEIKKAYRRLVLKYHPDRNPENTRAVRKMQEINTAFEVLGDPEKREAYDLEHQFDSQKVAAETQSSPTTKADQEDAEVQFNLGVMYYDGEGVPRNYHQAFTWLKKAADQGHAGAQYKLGLMYCEGTAIGVSGKFWDTTQDLQQATMWFKKAADQGHAEAQYRLGKAYYEFHGASGVPKNDLQAALWYRRAADQGHVGAQTSLGVLYYNGEGVPQDYDQAALWLQKAADQGDTLAQSWLNRLEERIEEKKSLEDFIEDWKEQSRTRERPPWIWIDRFFQRHPVIHALFQILWMFLIITALAWFLGWLSRF